MHQKQNPEPPMEEFYLKEEKKYDYVFLGSGLAANSILIRMLQSGKFQDKRFLLVDKDKKNRIDRTWCYWEMGKGFFESLVFKQWSTLDFLSPEFSKSLNIAPYHYKMIRGKDFYRYCQQQISQHHNVDSIEVDLPSDFNKLSRKELSIVLERNDSIISLEDATIFNSIYLPSSPQKGQIDLLQHFKGWVIQTGSPEFDPGKAILMDFRVSQINGTTFSYVLPFSDTEALVEYTLFSDQLLPAEQYDRELKTYIQDTLKIENFEIVGKEFGVIPMTNQRFSFYKDGMYHIGTAGGQTKASSGYTFQFIQKQSQEIVECLQQGRSLNEIALAPRRFRFYDNTLLHILYHKKLSGKQIFTDLFKKNPSTLVLKFLDNETSLKEELKLISSLPTWPFLQSALLH